MKEKIVLFLAVALVTGATFFAVVKHDERQREVIAVATAAQHKAELEQAASSAAQLQASKDAAELNSALLLQCQVGVEAWDKLSTPLQKTQPKPDCELSFR